MSAVREALGALIPARLHRSLDAAVHKQRQDLGDVRGVSKLSMEGWGVSVRAEDALSQGSLQEEVLELFLKVLNKICKQLKLSVAIGSKTVGKEAGRQESPSKLASIMEHWRKVWDGGGVRAQPILVLPVAVDEGDKPKDWMCVLVSSVVPGQRLGDAAQLLVQVHDSSVRASVARRLSQNLDMLVRGLGAGSGCPAPRIEFLETRSCSVNSQRMLLALGLLLGHVGRAAGVETLSAMSEAFVPDTSHVLRAVFVYMRTQLGEKGYRDAEKLFEDADGCRTVLRMLGARPSLRTARDRSRHKRGVAG